MPYKLSMNLVIIILTGNEITKYYKNCHKIFDKQGYFHQEVSIYICFNTQFGNMPQFNNLQNKICNVCMVIQKSGRVNMTFFIVIYQLCISINQDTQVDL